MNGKASTLRRIFPLNFPMRFLTDFRRQITRGSTDGRSGAQRLQCLVRKGKYNPAEEVPIFAMPNIPTGQALILMAVVMLIMVFFPPFLSQITFGALMLYILYRVVTNYN